MGGRVQTLVYVCLLRHKLSDPCLFSSIFHPTMSNALKKRKIAVLGSRSVGEFQFWTTKALKKNSYFLGKSSLVKQFIEV